MTTIYQDDQVEIGHRAAFEKELIKDHRRDSNYKKWNDPKIVADEWAAIVAEEENRDRNDKMIKRKCVLCGNEINIIEDGEEDTETFVCGMCNIGRKEE